MNDQKKLTHPHGQSKESAFKMIDENGGWPHNAKSIVFEHTTERACYFSEREDVRDGWNTSFATSDEYYLWKLSPKATKELESQIKNRLLDRLYRA